MKCPLFTTSSIDKGGRIDYKRWECLKEECAWWDNYYDQCLWKSILVEIKFVNNGLADLINKMPHAGQFTK